MLASRVRRLSFPAASRAFEQLHILCTAGEAERKSELTAVGRIGAICRVHINMHVRCGIDSGWVTVAVTNVVAAAFAREFKTFRRLHKLPNIGIRYFAFRGNWRLLWKHTAGGWRTSIIGHPVCDLP